MSRGESVNHLITVSSTSPRRLTLWLPVLALLLVIAAAMPFAGARANSEKKVTPVPAPPAVNTVEPVYSVSAGIDGEIYPAIANFAASQKATERQLPTVSVRVTNNGGELLKNRIAVSIPGWSDQEIQMAEVAPGVTRTFRFAPTFLTRAYSNREIAPATVTVVASDAGGRAVFSATTAVRIRATEDMYWGARFKYAPFIAAWVTPHDPLVEDVLRRAKENMPGRRMPGYEEWKSNAGQTNSTYLQAKAIFDAMQGLGVSYVKSSVTFGNNTDISERVRLPRETLRRSAANCIDGAVVYAAAFENLGMDPVIVLVPGHAYVGVREAQNSSNYLYIETSLTGRATFENAVLSASRGMSKVPNGRALRVDIARARDAGIYPMPLPGSQTDGLPAMSGERAR